MATKTNEHSYTMTTSIAKELQLEEWRDFAYTPQELSDILTINLSEEFRHVFGLLYTVKEGSERSSRALKLTSRAIRLNPGNPSAWMLRREVVQILSKEDKSIWKRELAFLSGLIRSHPKNYQAWEHRRFAAEGGEMLKAELGFTDVILYDDAKNYHAWSHRQWLVRVHALGEGELAATECFLLSDVRNNSAWNHRWLITGLREGGRDMREMKFALEMMMTAPRNEAVWNYIHMLGKEVGTEEAKSRAKEVLKIDAGCVSARRFLVFNSEDAEEVRGHCEILGGIDKIREKYWRIQEEAARKMIAQKSPRR